MAEIDRNRHKCDGNPNRRIQKINDEISSKGPCRHTYPSGRDIRSKTRLPIRSQVAAGSCSSVQPLDGLQAIDFIFARARPLRPLLLGSASGSLSPTRRVSRVGRLATSGRSPSTDSRSAYPNQTLTEAVG